MMAQAFEADRVFDILLVEDNKADVLLMQEALKDGNILNRLSVVRTGEEALDFLYRRGAYRDVPRPDLIMLDLNLPRKDGREVLAEIKKDPEIMSIPVVVITTSRSDADIIRAYNLHANCYISKPVRLAQFFKVVKDIQDFWFRLVKLPPKRE